MSNLQLLVPTKEWFSGLEMTFNLCETSAWSVSGVNSRRPPPPKKTLSFYLSIWTSDKLQSTALDAEKSFECTATHDGLWQSLILYSDVRSICRSTDRRMLEAVKYNRGRFIDQDDWENADHVLQLCKSVHDKSLEFQRLIPDIYAKCAIKLWCCMVIAMLKMLCYTMEAQIKTVLNFDVLCCIMLFRWIN